MIEGPSANFYFAYGSNMDVERVQQRGMAFVGRISGRLAGYRLVFNKRAKGHRGIAHANIELSAAGQVEGVLYALAAPESILQMDPYEGYPIRYSRTILSIETETCVAAAWVYEANAQFIETDCKPTQSYLNHLLAGAEFLSATYLADLSATPVAEATS
ncbi:MAG: gamma-glutamylcyclotransferase [Pseudomonadales bacterium]|nr:gamma-glutamylcyclotransferase [Pseudomonadales bacterium]